MVNTLSGSVSAYRNGSIKKRYIRVDEVMSMLEVTKEEALEIALAAGARYQLAKITLIHKERLMDFMKHFTRVPRDTVRYIRNRYGQIILEAYNHCAGGNFKYIEIRYE